MAERPPIILQQMMTHLVYLQQYLNKRSSITNKISEVQQIKFKLTTDCMQSYDILLLRCVCGQS